MSVAEDIREAIRAARTASQARPDERFKPILDEVAAGLTDGGVEARVTPGAGGRWTLWLFPACQPGRAHALVSVMVTGSGAEVLTDPKQTAATPEALAGILKDFVTRPAVLESLQEIARLSTLPVEGFLRKVPRTVSREDLLLEVPPAAQREIATRVDGEVALQLRLSTFPGAGTFVPGAGYQVLESAGFSVTLTQPVTQREDGALQIVGRVSRANVP